MIVVALQRKEARPTAALPYFLSKFISSLLDSSSNQSAGVAGQLNCENNGGIYSNHSCNKPKFASSLGTSFNEGSPTILMQARNPAILAEELENALNEQRIEDALKGYEIYKQLEDFPRKSLVNRLISVLAYSGDSTWLEKAYAVVISIMEEKKQRQLLDREALTHLCLSLARAQMPVPASTVLRVMVGMEEYPSVNMWNAVITHMVKTENGARLASEIVIEMCYFFKDGRVDPRKRSNRSLLAMKPNTEAFNISLNGSLAFGMTRKAEELLVLMTEVGVKADATSIALRAQIYEKNGRREELKKLKRHIEESSGMPDHHYQQFYSSLLITHLKFGDLDAASELILDMLKRAKATWSSLAATKPVLATVAKGLQGHATSMEYGKERICSAMLVKAEKLQAQSLVEVNSHGELVSFENHILVPNQNAYAKLVMGYLEANRANDLTEFLVKVHREEGPVSMECSISAQVIDACIVMGWLDQAHDIIGELNAANVPISVGVYSSLLKAYCKARQPKEAATLLKEVRKAGLRLDESCYDALIESHLSNKDIHGALDLFKQMREAKVSCLTNTYQSLMNGLAKESKPNLMARLLDEIKDDRQVAVGTHDWNSVIHFFCKAHLMNDAQKAFNKMTALGYHPNAQTFHSLIHGYSAAGGQYQEITMLWENMKRMASAVPDSGIKPLKFDQELLDAVLYSFVRGGFFERALEVISMMERQKMVINKFNYRQVYLRYHRDLYKNKKTPKAQTEAQSTRREQVMAFKKWAGLD
jgi:pentatricopeptide repeat protein